MDEETNPINEIYRSVTKNYIVLVDYTTSCPLTGKLIVGNREITFDDIGNFYYANPDFIWKDYLFAFQENFEQIGYLDEDEEAVRL
jgi:hypothetical protein